jgi:hypothetical protein
MAFAIIPYKRQTAPNGGPARVYQTPSALSTVLQSRASLLTVITWLV